MQFLLQKKHYQQVGERYRKATAEHVENLRQGGLKKIIVINGLPKSGNSWLCRIVATYLDCAVIGYIGGPDDEEVSERPSTGNDQIAVLKSHHVPSNFEGLDKNFVKVLHIVRDPRDVTVSAAAYFRKGMFQNRILRPLALLLSARTITRNNPGLSMWWLTGWTGYYGSLKNPDRHVVRYESLLEKDIDALRDFLKDAQGEADEKKIYEALEETSFASMKKSQDDMAKSLLRSGKKGDYKKTLPKLLIWYINTNTAPVRASFGYE